MPDKSGALGADPRSATILFCGPWQAINNHPLRVSVSLSEEGTCYLTSVSKDKIQVWNLDILEK